MVTDSLHAEGCRHPKGQKSKSLEPGRTNLKWEKNSLDPGAGGKKVKEKERMKTLGDALYQLSAAPGAQFKDSPGNQKT